MNTRATAAALFTGALAAGSLALYVLRTSDSDLYRASFQTDETLDGSNDIGEPSGGAADKSEVEVGSIGERSTAPSQDSAEQKADQSFAPEPVLHIPPTAQPQILRVIEDYRLAPLPGADPQTLAVATQRILERDSVFVAEAVDFPWARRTESEIVEEIAGINGPELVTLQVECRTATCRVQLVQRVPGSEPLDRPSPSVRAFHNELNARLDLQPGLWTLSVDRYGAAHSIAHFQRRDSAQANSANQ